MRDGLANMNVSPKGKKAKMAPYQGLFFFGSSNFSLPASSNEKILCTLCLRRLHTLKWFSLVLEIKPCRRFESRIRDMEAENCN